MSNKQRSDSDPRFKVKIEGLSRARWSLVLEQLYKLSEKTEDEVERQTRNALETVVHALESHLFDNYDGYSLSANEEPALSEIEKKAMQACRSRYEEKLAQQDKHAKELELYLKEKKKKGEKLTPDEKEILESLK